MKAKITGAKIQILVFLLEGKCYGIDIKYIKSIIERDIAITRVPHTKEYVEGVINLRGDIVPVIDLQKRINKKADFNYTEDTRIIILNCNDVNIGFMVDSVTEVIKLADDEFENSVSSSDIGENLFIGTGKFNNSVIPIINVMEIINQDIITT